MNIYIAVLPQIAVSLIAALVISLAMCPLVKSFAYKVGAIDVPKDNRRMHKTPIPRLGGLAIFIGFMVSILLFAEITSEMKSILVRLSEMGPKTVVITSAYICGEYCNAGYDREHNKFWWVPYVQVNAGYPGTGDVFASVLTGSVLRGDSLPIAMNRAASFLELAIKTTYGYSTDPREGILLERCLDFLTENHNLCDYETL